MIRGNQAVLAETSVQQVQQLFFLTCMFHFVSWLNQFKSSIFLSHEIISFDQPAQGKVTGFWSQRWRNRSIPTFQATSAALCRCRLSLAATAWSSHSANFTNATAACREDHERARWRNMACKAFVTLEYIWLVKHLTWLRLWWGSMLETLSKSWFKSHFYRFHLLCAIEIGAQFWCQVVAKPPFQGPPFGDLELSEGWLCQSLQRNRQLLILWYPGTLFLRLLSRVYWRFFASLLWCAFCKLLEVCCNWTDLLCDLCVAVTVVVTEIELDCLTNTLVVGHSGGSRRQPAVKRTAQRMWGWSR